MSASVSHYAVCAVAAAALSHCPCRTQLYRIFEPVVSKYEGDIDGVIANMPEKARAAAKELGNSKFIQEAQSDPEAFAKKYGREAYNAANKVRWSARACYFAYLCISVAGALHVHVCVCTVRLCNSSGSTHADKRRLQRHPAAAPLQAGKSVVASYVAKGLCCTALIQYNSVLRRLAI
jgi:hypothetical protein